MNYMGYGRYDSEDRKELAQWAKDNGMKRFHYMNAFIVNWHDCQDFYSYRSRIARYWYRTGILEVDIDLFDCSVSTRKQFGRWLQECGYGTYGEVAGFAAKERKAQDAMYVPEPTGQVFVTSVGQKVTFI